MSKIIVALVLLSLVSVALGVCNQACVKPNCHVGQLPTLHPGACCPVCAKRACTELCVQPNCGTGYHAVQTPYSCCPVCVNDHDSQCNKVNCPQLACAQGFGLVKDLAYSCCPFCVEEY